MSYTICYDRRFIKSGLGITPMWLAGDSNCYEPRRTIKGRSYERRDRSWQPLFNMAGVPAEELMEKVRSCTPSKYQEHFKYRGKWVDDKAFIAFVEKGIKNAVTIEELEKAAGHSAFSAKLSVWKYNPEKGYSDMEKPEQVQRISTTAELDEWISLCKMRMESKQEGESIYFHIDLYTDEPIPFPKMPPKNCPVMIREKARKFGGYLAKIEEKGISFSPVPEDAMIFPNADAAIAAIPAWFDKKRYTVVNADAVLMKRTWKWVVRVASGYHQGRFVKECTRSAVKFAPTIADAKKFPSKKAAERYIMELDKKRWQNPITFDAANLDGEEENR